MRRPSSGDIGGELNEPATSCHRPYQNPRPCQPFRFGKCADGGVDNQQHGKNEHLPHLWEAESRIGRKSEGDQRPTEKQSEGYRNARPAQRQSRQQQNPQGDRQQNLGNGDGKQNRQTGSDRQPQAELFQERTGYQNPSIQYLRRFTLHSPPLCATM